MTRAIATAPTDKAPEYITLFGLHAWLETTRGSTSGILREIVHFFCGLRHRVSVREPHSVRQQRVTDSQFFFVLCEQPGTTPTSKRGEVVSIQAGQPFLDIRVS